MDNSKLLRKDLQFVARCKNIKMSELAKELNINSYILSKYISKDTEILYSNGCKIRKWVDDNMSESIMLARNAVKNLEEEIQHIKR